ncbi:MAG: hypothetical protein ABIJ59_00535 [Pseudomonadota bacterium]
MKTLLNLITLIIVILISNQPSFAQGTHSGQAVKNSAQASASVSKGAAHSIAASSQVASAVIAIPFMALGASGAVSAKVGEDLWDAANKPAGRPLEITDETISAGPPPDEVINVNGKNTF